MKWTHLTNLQKCIFFHCLAVYNSCQLPASLSEAHNSEIQAANHIVTGNYEVTWTFIKITSFPSSLFGTQTWPQKSSDSQLVIPYWIHKFNASQLLIPNWVQRYNVSQLGDSNLVFPNPESWAEINGIFSHHLNTNIAINFIALVPN